MLRTLASRMGRRQATTSNTDCHITRYRPRGHGRWARHNPASPDAPGWQPTNRHWKNGHKHAETTDHIRGQITSSRFRLQWNSSKRIIIQTPNLSQTTIFESSDESTYNRVSVFDIIEKGLKRSTNDGRDILRKKQIRERIQKKTRPKPRLP